MAGRSYFTTGSAVAFSRWIFSHPLPSSPIGSGGRMSTFFSPSFASPRSTFYWTSRHSFRSFSRICSSGILATTLPCT